jgi:hypothetical protein
MTPLDLFEAGRDIATGAVSIAASGSARPVLVVAGGTGAAERACIAWAWAAAPASETSRMHEI